MMWGDGIKQKNGIKSRDTFRNDSRTSRIERSLNKKEYYL